MTRRGRARTEGVRAREGATLLLLAGLALVGCSNFKQFKAYVPTAMPQPGAARFTVKLNVWNAPDEFTIYPRRLHPDRYRREIRDYVKESLSAELRQVGFQLTETVAPGVVIVDAHVNQFDLGYEKAWWTTAVAFVGYSKVKVGAVADVTIEAVMPKRGDRYRRRFMARSEYQARLLWLGFFLPILPLPISGFYDEAEQVAIVSNDCFRRVALSLEELVRNYGS